MSGYDPSQPRDTVGRWRATGAAIIAESIRDIDAHLGPNPRGVPPGHWSPDDELIFFPAERPGDVDGRPWVKGLVNVQTGETKLWIPNHRGRPHHDDVRVALTAYHDWQAFRTDPADPRADGFFFEGQAMHGHRGMDDDDLRDFIEAAIRRQAKALRDAQEILDEALTGTANWYFDPSQPRDNMGRWTRFMLGAELRVDADYVESLMREKDSREGQTLLTLFNRWTALMAEDAADIDVEAEKAQQNEMLRRLSLPVRWQLGRAADLVMEPVKMGIWTVEKLWAVFEYLRRRRALRAARLRRRGRQLGAVESLRGSVRWRPSPILSPT